MKLEAGVTNVSLIGLGRLDDALGVTSVDVDLDPAPAEPHTDVSAVAWRGNEPWSISTFLPSVPASKEAQLWACTLEPGDRFDAEPDPVGWSEMLLLIEGLLYIGYESRSVELPAADHFAFPTSQRYACVNSGDLLTTFARIVVS